MSMVDRYKRMSVVFLAVLLGLVTSAHLMSTSLYAPKDSDSQGQDDYAGSLDCRKCHDGSSIKLWIGGIVAENWPDVKGESGKVEWVFFAIRGSEGKKAQIFLEILKNRLEVAELIS